MARYFYAQRKRNPLEVDIDRIGVDGERATKAGLSSELSRAKKAGTKMPGGIFIVERSQFTRPELQRLQKAGATHVIYRDGKKMILLMPEVRVELGTSDRSAVLAAARDAGVAAEIDENEVGQLVLRPHSGSGEEALSLANFIYEKAHPAASSPRMLQNIPRPEAGGSIPPSPGRMRRTGAA